MVSYFERTPLDAEFYARFIAPRIPERVTDMHVHITKPEFVKNVPQVDFWANECMAPMDYGDYAEYTRQLWPGVEVSQNFLPFVFKGTDVKGNNAYLASLKASGKAKYTHMLVTPDMSPDDAERVLTDGRFDGFKPYLEMVLSGHGGEVSCFDFITREQLAILDRLKKTMVLHLPRAGRFPDDDNIRELREMRQRFPDMKIIIAHCGRSYAVNTIKEARRKLGSDAEGFYYDLAAVLNPAVLGFMLDRFPADRIFYGTDLPIFLWHGRRVWTDDSYRNLVREDFRFNRHSEGPEAEAGYTFFVYEQMKNILDAAYERGGRTLAEKILYRNAQEVLG